MKIIMAIKTPPRAFNREHFNCWRTEIAFCFVVSFLCAQ